MRFFYRYPRIEALYSQDHPTFIMVGRWAHLYNWRYKVWLVVDPPPDNLNRDTTEMVPITFRDFLRNTSRRAWLELIEDLLGIRFKFLAMRLRQRVSLLRHNRFLKFVQTIDDRQDFSEWENYCEPPKWGVSPEEAEAIERSRSKS